MSEERETTSTINVTVSTASANVVALAKPVEPRLMLTDVVVTKKDAKALADLLAMFDRCRPHDTKATLDFAVKWLKPLGAKIDARGNWTLRIGPPVGSIGSSKVIWSSHIDTVDWNEGLKSTVLNHDTGVLRLSDRDKSSSCLGADCTTGVWIMREMAKAKVPGLYIWHEAEESGGQGSSWIAKNRPELLEGMQAAIAFDRKGFADIITEQSGGMCCSDAFAKALAKQLPDTGFKPDPTGSFTDTAIYTGVIPECTNLSIGYFSQHGKNETQNVIFAMLMRAAMVRFTESKLVIKRKPGEGAYTYGRYYGMGYTGGGGYGLNDWWEDGYSKGGYKEQPRTYILTGDKVRIRASAVGHGAYLGDVGKEGHVSLVRYTNPKVLDITLAQGVSIKGLLEEHVDRVVEEKYAPKPALAAMRFDLGDRVVIGESARHELNHRMLRRPIDDIIGKEGTVTGLGMRHDWIDVKLDNGQQLFSLKSTDLMLAPEKAAHGKVALIDKPKDYSKTKCGGLCGGKCQGMCADPVKLKMLQRLAAKVDAGKEKSRTDANAAIRRLGGSDAEKAVMREDTPQPKDDGKFYPKEPDEGRACRNILDFIITYPDQVADLIEQWGFGVEDLYNNFPNCL